MEKLKALGLVFIATLATVLLAGVSLAADKIVLSCSTTDLDLKYPGFGKTEGPPLSIVIDLDRGIMSIGATGETAITKVNEQTIIFDGKDGEGTIWSGGLDRISGAGTITLSRGREPLFSTELACKPAKSLF